MPLSWGSSQSRDQTQVSYVSCIWRWVLYHQRHLGSPLLGIANLNSLVHSFNQYVFTKHLLNRLSKYMFIVGGGNGNPLQYSCLENPMDRRAWWAAVHRVAKSQTWLSDLTFTFHFHALEKKMAAHSSVLAWRIPGMGEPAGLPSMGSHRVGHDWSDLAAAAAATQSTILTWRIPWTEDLGLHSPTGLQRVRHDWSDLALTHTWAPNRQGCRKATSWVRLVLCL